MKTFVFLLTPDCKRTDRCFLYACYGNPEIGNDRYRVLLTKVPPKPRTDGEQLRAMLMHNDIPVFAAEVPNLVAFDKASAEGVLVSAVHDARAKRGWDAYEAAGKEISHG